MRSLGGKNESPIPTSSEGSSRKKPKCANVDFKFQSARASQESIRRALQLYRLNAALQVPPPSWTLSSACPRQYTFVRSFVRPEITRPLLPSLMSPGPMVSFVQAPHVSYPIGDYLHSQAQHYQSVLRDSLSTAAAAATAESPLRMAPTNVWSPTMVAPPLRTLHPSSFLHETTAVVAPVMRTFHMAPSSFLSDATTAMVARAMFTSRMAPLSLLSDAAAMVPRVMGTSHMAPVSLLRETAAMMPPAMRTPQMAPILPFTLSCPTDRNTLSVFQVFMRLHIEAFGATYIDTMSYTRGRTKRIHLGQVGIRCRHCAHVPPSQRNKGAVYFPASTLGVYQAAQNMCATHLHCGLCPAMPESTKAVFTKLMETKTSKTYSGGGRAYWSQCVQQMGLVDTDQGVYSREMIPPSAHVMDPNKQSLYQTNTMKRPHSQL